MTLDGEGAILFITQNGTEREYDIKIHRSRRSNDANAYFHRLVGLLADGEHCPFYEKKNELIIQYGTHEFERDDDGRLKHVILPDDDRWKRCIDRHYFPTSYTDVFRGQQVRAFVLLKGTRTYDSKQMYHLIEGTRNECLGCDIPWEEVATPREQRLFERLNT